MALEEEFGVQVDVDDALEMVSYPEVVATMLRYTNNRPVENLLAKSRSSAAADGHVRPFDFAVHMRTLFTDAANPNLIGVSAKMTGCTADPPPAATHC